MGDRVIRMNEYGESVCYQVVFGGQVSGQELPAEPDLPPRDFLGDCLHLLGPCEAQSVLKGARAIAEEGYCFGSKPPTP